jgi:hypothetical protein
MASMVGGLTGGEASMTVASSTAVQLVGALAWPAAILAAVVLLRKPLASLLEDLGKRATKLSIFQFAVELATVPELAPSWNVPGGDVRQLTRADVFDSATMSLFQELSGAGASDYIVVDLGGGNQWLSSRLYIFVLLLQRMRRLTSVVFTAAKGDETGVFIGIADPARVRWALAMEYPWLESAFARAYAQIAPCCRVATRLALHRVGRGRARAMGCEQPGAGVPDGASVARC